MERVVGVARGRAMRAAMVVGVAVAALVGFAAPAFPTDISIYGTTPCTTGDQTVSWTITNAAPGIPMTISYVVASIGSQQYPTNGWSPIVAGDASTNATTVVPAGGSGLLVLNVYATWANGATRVVGGVIDLPTNCTPPTTTTTTTAPAPTTTAPPAATTSTTTTQWDTTTTQPETATTAPDTATTVPETATTEPVPTTVPYVPPTDETTTSTVAVSGTTIVTGTTTPGPPTTVTRSGTPGGPTPGGTTTTTKRGPPTLPRTGTATTFLFIFGAFFVAVGGSILMHKRNSWAALRGHETTADVRKQFEKKKRALTVYLPPRR